MNTKEKKFGTIISKRVFIKKQLDSLEISNKYTGYYMVVEVLELLINGEIKVVSFSRQIYPIVAKKFNASDCTVERNIRNLIKKCCSEALMLKLGICCGKTKVTCQKFVLLIKDYICKQIY